MPEVIQVPSWPGRGVAEQAVMTSAKAVSQRMSKRPALRLLRSERPTCNWAGSSTKRGSGECHRTGWPSLNQGKMPRE